MSSVFSCWWWWLLLGALLGWLLSWWLSGNTHRQISSSWSSRFADVEGRHAATLRQKETEITRLQGKYDELNARPLPVAEVKIVERIVDRPVERVIEKIVERPVDRIIEKTVERPVERILEKLVQVQVDNPNHLQRIRELEAEAALIAGLRSQISALQSAPPKFIERIVERPVDRIVEKVVTVNVDNPRHLGRIRELESEVALVSGLRSQINALQSASPQIIERIVERPVDRIVERRVTDTQGLEERDRQIAELRMRLESLEHTSAATIAARDAEIDKLRASRPAVLDKAAALAAGFKVRGMDDLEIVEGIGPKIAELLNADGIHYFIELAQSSTARIQGILDRAGPNYRLARPDTWPQQASLAAANRWAELRKLQDELAAGNRS